MKYEFSELKKVFEYIDKNGDKGTLVITENSANIRQNMEFKFFTLKGEDTTIELYPCDSNQYTKITITKNLI
jgi:hypothetical protein